ncbi:MAG: bifunctional DNA-formamidopyrimidine glycosylase/DNA-(apurinic or apyrimidinic site) lyase [Magnetovibrio sp.]|nr:bifunctional DNA-formamidopyrimidine glycosylase/DNA-(apurinic or apyrimidinic site) lyase [Magnetovibrio sp.]
MPELPEVETVRRGLAPALEDRRLARVIIRRRDLRWPLPDDFGQRLTGRRVRDVGRRAKFLTITLDDGTVWIAHLGMSGRFRIFHGDAPPEEPHDHVIVETEEGVVVRFNDPRRFGFMDLADAVEADGHPMLRDLGPEPLGDGFDAGVLADRLAGRAAPIKAALLDQRTVAGLGNIYVCEALFQAGISPRRKARTVQGGRAGRLAAAIKDVLGRAIEAGGSSLQDHRQTNGELGYFQHDFQTYGRAGEPCRRCGDGHPVRQIVQSGRSTFFCPNCQR